jgi:hypothetical protein
MVITAEFRIQQLAVSTVTGLCAGCVVEEEETVASVRLGTEAGEAVVGLLGLGLDDFTIDATEVKLTMLEDAAVGEGWLDGELLEKFAEKLEFKVLAENFVENLFVE